MPAPLDPTCARCRTPLAGPDGSTTSGGSATPGGATIRFDARAHALCAACWRALLDWMESCARIRCGPGEAA